MKSFKLNISQITTIISILYINNAFFGFIKENTILNALCLLCMVLWLIVASKEIGFLQNCLRTCSPLIFYTCFLILVYFFTGANMGTGMWQNLRNAFFSLICSFLCLYALVNDEKSKRKICTFLLINILLGCVYTLYKVQENPLLPRILAKSAQRVETDLGGNVSSAGIITYGGIYGMALIIPSFLYWISQKQGQKKIVPIIVLIVSVVTIYKAQFAISLFSIIAGIALYRILCNGKYKYRYIIAGVLVIIIFIVAVYWDNILYILYSANILPSALQQKAHELLLYSEGGNLTGTNLNSRLLFYGKSFEAIKQNNFVGKVFSNNASGGGHSEWEDMAANYGVIAPLLVYFFFRKSTRTISAYLDDKAIMVYRIQLLIFLVVGFVDPIFHSRTMSYLMFLSPLVLTLIDIFKSILSGEVNYSG